MRLSQEAIRRMMDGRSGGGVGGGGSFDPSALAGYATQAWTEENYISKTFFNELFVIHKKVTTVVMDGDTEISRTVTTNSIFAPNEIPGTTTETDEETGYVTTVTTEISSIESKKGFWTNYFISALGLNSEGGGGGITLNEPLATINVSGLANHPSSSGQTIVWNGSAWVYGTAGGGTGTVTGVKVGDITYSPVNGIVSIPAYPTSMAWSAITGKPTTLAGYGITDAKIENGVITLGSNTITPLTSSAITDMATKTWVGQQGFALASNVYSKTDADAKFMTIAAFENLFNALNSSDQKVGHPYSSGVASIKAMVGLWTEQYLSALGKSDSGGEIVLNEPLASINDAGLAAHPSSSGQTIVWNGSAWTYGTAGGSGMTYTFATGDANGQFKVTPSSGAAYNVNIKGLAALAYKASLVVSDIPDLSGRYLPLTGGDLTGNLAVKSGFDLSQPNNGISGTSNSYYGYYIKDGNNKRSAQYINTVSPQGYNSFWISVTYDVSGTSEKDHGFGLTVDKQGNCTWNISQPTAFRTAIDALSKTDINSYTWWGRVLSNGVVNGDMTNVGNISFSASGKNIGGLMSFVTAGNGTVGVGTLSPNTNYKLDVNGYTKTSRLYLSDTIYMVVQNDGIHIVGGGLYADTYVSALGLSDSGSSGGIDWDALAANTNEQINVSHLTTALAPYALTSQMPTSLKNPYKLTITLNGTPTEYDGSVARSLTINTGLDQQALTTYLSSKILTIKNGAATLGTWNPTAAGTIDIASAMAGYLPLTGGTLTGGVNMKFGHDLTKGDNGITSTQYYGIRVYDKNSYLSAQFLNQVQTDGTNALNLNLRNRNGGTEHDKSLMVYLTKSGVVSAALDGVFTATSFNSTVATGTSPLTVASTTVVSNLNADLLDGYHANNVFQAAVQMMTNANTSMTNMLLATITLSDSDSLEVGGFSAVFNSREMTDKNGFFLSLSIRRTNRTTIGCDFHYIPLGTIMPEVPYVCSDDGATFYVYMPSSGTGWRSYYAVTKINAENCLFNLETTDSVISGTRLNATAVMGGAVSSAAKLQTARKIWGQNFDGSANVDGHLHSKGVYGGFVLYSGYASGEAIRMEALDANGTWVSMGLTLLQNGNVGIGTNSPIVNFDVSGNARVTDKLYLYKPNAANDTGAVYLKYDTNNGGVHLVGGGLYADTYISALGLSDSGGSAFDETAMWQALGTTITDKDIALAYIQTAADTRYALKTDIPTLSNLSWSYGSVTAASGNSYNGGAARSFVIPKNTSHLVNDSGFVTSSALGSYLPLTGGTLTDNLNIKYSHDLSKSNNGVSDTLWPGYRIHDKDGRRSAQFVNGVYSSGSNFVWMSVSNYDTSGNMVADYGIGLSVDKNGAGTWSVSEPAAFRTAIGIPTLLGGYLPLTGGTMSGNIIGSNGSHFSVRMSRDTSNAVYGLEWLNTSNTHIGGILYFNTEQKMILNSTNAQDLWSDAVGKYSFIVGNNHLTYNTYTIWHAGNDGAGSGLDADTLDGVHASQLQTAIQYNAGGTGGSLGWVKVARITIGGAWTSQPLIFKVVQRGRNGATLTLRFTNVGTISDARVDNFTYNGDMETATIVNVTSGSVWDLYIRKTEAWDNIGISQIDKGANIASINVTWTNEQAASVPTGVNDGANDRTAVFNNPASNLKTAVNIWGNSFNGTSDINGNLIMPNSRGIVIKDTNGVEQNVFVYNQNNDIVIGWGPRATSDTFITGNTINIARNGGTSAIYVNTSNNVGIGGSAGDSTYKLTVAGAAKVNELWIGNIRITASAEGIHIANGGLSANTYVSALGVGDQGGGSGGADLETVWNSMAENDSSHYIHISHIQSALSSYLSSNNYITSSSITDMATKTWVGQQGYITSSALTGYATQQWVKSQGYVTNAGVTSVGMSVPTGLRVNSAASATITGTGTFALTFTSGYSIPTTAKQSNWDTAYGWGNHASAGYATPSSVATQMQSYAYISGNVIHIGDSSITPLTSHQSVDGTFWGQSWSNHGTVNGSIEAGNSGGYIGGFDHIDLNTHASLYGYGGYIDFYYNGANSYTSRIIEEESGVLSIKAPNVAGLLVGGYNGDYVQIGQIRIVYESSNNALRIENANNGGAANLYAMGGISALGMSGNADGTISGNLIPSANATYSIGSSSYGWKELRLSQYGVSGRITIDGDGINLVSNEGGYLSGALYMVTGRMIVGSSDDDYDGFTFATEGTSYLSSKVSIGGTNSNSDKLYVNGTVRASSYNNSSDARLKNIISNENIDIETIARAPIVRFTWKNNNDPRVHWGTLAQYWRSTEIGDIVEDGEYLAMDYAATALAGVISVARKVVTHEERIAALEAENERLRNEIETLKAA